MAYKPVLQEEEVVDEDDELQVAEWDQAAADAAYRQQVGAASAASNNCHGAPVSGSSSFLQKVKKENIKRGKTHGCSDDA